ncbi:MAG: hypothetical protein JWR38_4345 [Mucilaginibacter sp.]|nr:hypothetical protein [Mucilaginibacter sp.]
MLLNLPYGKLGGKTIINHERQLIIVLISCSYSYTEYCFRGYKIREIKLIFNLMEKIIKCLIINKLTKE